MCWSSFHFLLTLKHLLWFSCLSCFLSCPALRHISVSLPLSVTSVQGGMLPRCPDPSRLHVVINKSASSVSFCLFCLPFHLWPRQSSVYVNYMDKSMSWTLHPDLIVALNSFKIHMYYYAAIRASTLLEVRTSQVLPFLMDMALCMWPPPRNSCGLWGDFGTVNTISLLEKEKLSPHWNLQPLRNCIEAKFWTECVHVNNQPKC